MPSYFFHCFTKEEGQPPLEQKFILQHEHPLVWCVKPETKAKYEKVEPIWWTQVNEISESPDTVYEILKTFQERPTTQEFIQQAMQPPPRTWWIWLTNGEPERVFKTLDMIGFKPEELPKEVEIRQVMEIGSATEK